MSAATTIILDESCAQLETAVEKFAPVHVFRRANGFRCAAILAAAELRTMLADRSLLGRAIYIAPSFAGFTALLAASRYPGSLAGILLVDPSHPLQGEVALRILADAPVTPELERLRSLLEGFGPAWEQSCREVAAIPELGNITLHVLAGGSFDLPYALPAAIKNRLVESRHALLSDYCRLSTRASFEIVNAAGHDMCGQAPEAVLSAIKRVLDATESGSRTVAGS